MNSQEMIHLSFPMLGIRMLCPRYTVATALSHLRILARFADFSCLPRIPETIVKAMLQHDFQRSQGEPASSPFCFVDYKNGGSYTYRMVSGMLLLRQSHDLTNS